MSSTAPLKLRDYHYKFSESFSEIHFNKKECWVKCDMVYVVSISRLRYLKDVNFQKKTIKIDQETLNIIRQKTGKFLGIILPSKEPACADS